MAHEKKVPPGNEQRISTEHGYVTSVTASQAVPSHNLTRNGQAIPRSGLDRHAAGMVRQPTSDRVFWHAPSGSSCGAGRSFTCLS